MVSNLFSHSNADTLSCYKTISVNYPVINLGLKHDSLKVMYHVYEVCYSDEHDLFHKLDSISESIYGIDNIHIKMLYSRYIDINDEEFLDISKVKIKSKNKSIIKIRIKKREILEQEYCPSIYPVVEDKIVLYFIRIG